MRDQQPCGEAGAAHRGRPWGLGSGCAHPPRFGRASCPAQRVRRLTAGPTAGWTRGCSAAPAAEPAAAVSTCTVSRFVQVGQRVHVDRRRTRFLRWSSHLPDQDPARVQRVVVACERAGGDDVFAACWPGCWRAGTGAADRWGRPPSAARCRSRLLVPILAADAHRAVGDEDRPAAASETAWATLPTKPSSSMTGSSTRTPADSPLSIIDGRVPHVGDLPTTTVAVTGR